MNFTLTVTPDALRTAAQEVATLTRQLQSDFDAMQTTVGRTKSYWIGAAGDQYRSGFANRKQETAEILDHLREYPTDLLKMAGLYDRTEEEVTDMSGGLLTHYIL